MAPGRVSARPPRLRPPQRAVCAYVQRAEQPTMMFTLMSTVFIAASRPSRSSTGSRA